MSQESSVVINIWIIYVFSMSHFVLHEKVLILRIICTHTYTYNVHMYIYIMCMYVCEYMCLYVYTHIHTHIMLSCLVPFCMFYESSVISVPVDNSCLWFASNSFWFGCYKLQFQLFPHIHWIISAWCNVFIEIFFNEKFPEQK